MKVWIWRKRCGRGFALSFKKPECFKKDLTTIPEEEIPDNFIVGDSDYISEVGNVYNIKIPDITDEFQKKELRAYELVQADELKALQDKVRKLETENNLLRASLNEPLIYSMS